MIAREKESKLELREREIDSLTNGLSTVIGTSQLILAGLAIIAAIAITYIGFANCSAKKLMLKAEKSFNNAEETFSAAQTLIKELEDKEQVLSERQDELKEPISHLESLITSQEINDKLKRIDHLIDDVEKLKKMDELKSNFSFYKEILKDTVNRFHEKLIVI